MKNKRLLAQIQLCNILINEWISVVNRQNLDRNNSYK